jgi:hypothetical protein
MQTNQKSRVVEYSIPWDMLKNLKQFVTDGSIKNEFSGIFEQKQDETVTKGKQIKAHTCSSEHECLAHANITTGEGDSAHFYDNVKFTYHTHPLYYYKEYKVRIAPPSGEDIGVFLRGCIEKKTCVHLVLSLEGIYIMIANPCFVRIARKLLKLNTPRSIAYYNIALVGAEILGMETHEYRHIWRVQEWLRWIRNRFVCRSIQTKDYANDIREKFGYHCSEETCEDFNQVQENVEEFQKRFREIASTYIDLSKCSETNPIQNSKWTQGNWIDVDFVPWTKAKRDGHILLKYVEV